MVAVLGVGPPSTHCVRVRDAPARLKCTTSSRVVNYQLTDSEPRAVPYRREKKKTYRSRGKHKREKTNRARVRLSCSDLKSTRSHLAVHHRTHVRLSVRSLAVAISELLVNAQARAVVFACTPEGELGTPYYIDGASDSCTKYLALDNNTSTSQQVKGRSHLKEAVK